MYVATFASPRVFDFSAAKVYEEHLGRNTIRVVNLSDLVPSLPLGSMGYKHVGEQLRVNSDSLFYAHQLDIYRNLIVNIEPDKFKSDNSASVYYYPSYFAAGLFSALTTIPGYFFQSMTSTKNEQQYFKQVRNKHQNASLSKMMKYSGSSNDQKAVICEDYESSEDWIIITDTTNLTEKEKSANSHQVENNVLTSMKESSTTSNGVIQTSVGSGFSETKKVKGTSLSSQQRSTNKESHGGTGVDTRSSSNNMAKVDTETSKLEEQLNEKQDKTRNLSDQVGNPTTDKAQLIKGRGVIHKKLSKKTNVSELSCEVSSKQARVDELTKERDQLAQEKGQLQEERNALSQDLVEKTKLLKQAEWEVNALINDVAQLNKQSSKLKDRLTKELNDVKEKLAQEQLQASQLGDLVTKLIREVDGTKAQLKNYEIRLKQAKLDFSELEDKLAQSNRQNSQLQEKLDNTQQSLNEEIGKLFRINEENIKLQSELKLEKHESNDLKTKLQEFKSKIRGQEGRVEDLQRQLQSKNEELKGKNKELSAISAQSRKQVAYSSISFVLSGAFAVGASLTMSHLAICVLLTVAALTFLAVGCYCLYKASTALSNVEVDQIRNGVNPTASGAQIS